MADVIQPGSPEWLRAEARRYMPGGPQEAGMTAAADSIEALRSALAEACDAFVECCGPYAVELAEADLLRWRALANPLFAGEADDG